MSSIERIILGAPIKSTIQGWIFRKRLLAVLREGLVRLQSDENLHKFTTRYLKHYPDKQMLPKLLEDSISDYRKANELGRLDYMDNYIRSLF